MNAVQSLIKRVQKTKHGFTDIQKTSEEVKEAAFAAN
jgi:hypothetical protein